MRSLCAEAKTSRSAGSCEDQMSRGSEDSSSDANSEDHTLFTRNLVVGDTADPHCPTGNGPGDDLHNIPNEPP